MDDNDFVIAATYCASPPSQEEWESQRKTFADLGTKLYNGVQKRPLPQHFRALERELERCYCSGAYIACVFVSNSIIETFLQSLTTDDREKMQHDLGYVDDELKWLRSRRNDLAHFGRPSNKLQVVVAPRASH